MLRYDTEWIDYTLASEQEFSVAVCGYSGLVRHLYIGRDPVRRAFARHVDVEEGFCRQGTHCLALDCPLNRSEPENLLHMLDMNEDEPLDEETARIWGTGSTLEGFLLFARRITAELPEELRRRREPLGE